MLSQIMVLIQVNNMTARQREKALKQMQKIVDQIMEEDSELLEMLAD